MGANSRTTEWSRAQFASGAAILAIILISLWANQIIAQRVRVDSALVARTFEVLASLDQVMALARDAETGQRGYLIAGDDSYLEPYHTALASLDGQIAHLATLTADDPLQQARVSAVRERVAAKVAELRQTIELRRNRGFDAARAVVVAGAGKAEMDALRRVVGEMRESERSLLVTRSVAAERSYRDVTIAQWTAAASSVAGLALFVLIVRGQLGELQELNRATRASANALQDADRRKDEFLATLAHELRNPLAPLRNSLQIMKLAPGNLAVIDQSRTVMERQLVQLVRLVDDLLDVSRINSGKLHLHTVRLSLVDVLHHAVETSRPLIDAAAHELQIELPREPLMVTGDATRLEQVFANLLNNATKYSAKGSRITITVVRENDEAVVRIRDTGIGIPADMLSAIFELFTQVDRSIDRAYSGLGIGLTLVRRLVEMHGGHITAASDGPGRGSEFTVHLPLASSEAGGPHVASEPRDLQRLLRAEAGDRS